MGSWTPVQLPISVFRTFFFNIIVIQVRFCYNPWLSGRSAAWFSAPALGAGGRRFKSSRPDQITGVPSQQSLLIHSENTISTSEIPFSPDREFLLPFCFQPGDVLGRETQGVRTQHGLQGFGEVFGGATQFNWLN